jgi:hypothetical protein
MSEELKKYTTRELKSEIERREGKVVKRCSRCRGKWTTYMGCSRSWREEEHCYGCRRPVENCTC